MKIYLRRILTMVFLAIFVLPNLALANVGNWQKGISIYPRNPEDFGTDNMKQVLEDLVDHNADTVTFVIPYYQQTYLSTEIFPGVDTPSDESIIKAIKWSHKVGLKVMLKPHLDSGGKIWRANINPRDRNAWFESYEKMLTHYAAIAQENDVEQICIGTELISMSSENINPDNTVRWKNIIAKLRQNFHGQLTYSANWGPSSSSFANEKDHIGFWSDLDFVGISAYFQLHTKDNSSSSLAKAWASWDKSDIVPLYEKFGKPIVFTEVGYRSSRNSAAAPYDYQNKGLYDATEQVNAYEALFEYWKDKPYISGVSVWDFYADPAAGGEGNTDYTPQNKPAMDVLARWFGTLPTPEETLNIPNPEPTAAWEMAKFFRLWIRIPNILSLASQT